MVHRPRFVFLAACLAAFLAALLGPVAARAQMPNRYGPPVGVEAARKIAATAVAEARKHGWTVAVAVVDAAGDLVFFERIDHTQVASATVAQEKARTAVRFKRPTKAFEEALAGGRQAILGLPGVTPLEGGIPLLVDNKIVGAIGVSGATSQQDGVCAQAAVDALARSQPRAAASPARK